VVVVAEVDSPVAGGDPDRDDVVPVHCLLDVVCEAGMLPGTVGQPSTADYDIMPFIRAGGVVKCSVLPENPKVR